LSFTWTYTDFRGVYHQKNERYLNRIFFYLNNREIGGRTLYRFRCSEAAGEPEQTFLFEVLPQFITNVIVKVSLISTYYLF
jgi:hypothetical protein